MRARLRTLLLLGTMALAPTGAAAQALDAYVQPPGMARLEFGGVFTAYDARFGADGKRVSLASDVLSGPLTAESFAPYSDQLSGLQTGLRDFFGSFDPSVAVDSESFRLGTPDVRIYDHFVRVPMGFSLGILPHVQIGARTEFVKGGRLVERLGFPEATVGANPDAAGNSAKLEKLGAQWADLGASTLLPTDSSTLGQALQRIAVAHGTDSLALPDSPVGEAWFTPLVQPDFGVYPLASGLEDWRLGDTELNARVLLLSTMGQRGFPGDSALFGLRSSVEASLLLPTGKEPDSLLLVPVAVPQGRSGYSVASVTDIFVGRHAWLTLAARYDLPGTQSLRRRVVPGSFPLAVAGVIDTVQFTPGRALSLTIAPRLRVAEAIALGARYGVTRTSDATVRARTADGIVTGLGATEAGTIQRFGLRLSYSSLPGYVRGEASFPAEFVLSYDRVLSGPPGLPAASGLTAQVSLLPRFWGGKKR
ncbi:MAG TPA: hypothetical protein VFL93_08445 [Longimicrobiaceae bacterium]|nr:hypothetical protein [Longimicrobiaceae bacterium]